MSIGTNAAAFELTGDAAPVGSFRSNQPEQIDVGRSLLLEESASSLADSNGFFTILSIFLWVVIVSLVLLAVSSVGCCASGRNSCGARNCGGGSGGGGGRDDDRPTYLTRREKRDMLEAVVRSVANEAATNSLNTNLSSLRSTVDSSAAKIDAAVANSESNKQAVSRIDASITNLWKCCRTGRRRVTAVVRSLKFVPSLINGLCFVDGMTVFDIAKSVSEPEALLDAVVATGALEAYDLVVVDGLAGNITSDYVTKIVNGIVVSLGQTTDNRMFAILARYSVFQKVSGNSPVFTDYVKNERLTVVSISDSTTTKSYGITVAKNVAKQTCYSKDSLADVARLLSIGGSNGITLILESTSIAVARALDWGDAAQQAITLCNAYDPSNNVSAYPILIARTGNRASDLYGADSLELNDKTTTDRAKGKVYGFDYRIARELYDAF